MKRTTLPRIADVYEFDGILDFGSYANDYEYTIPFNAERVNSFSTGSRSWRWGFIGKSSTMSDVAATRCNNKRILDALSKSRNVKIDNSKSLRRRKRYNDYDGDFDHDRIMTGQSDFYVRKTRVSMQSRVKRYYVNMATSASIDPDTIIERYTDFFNQIYQEIQRGAVVEVNGIFANRKAMYNSFNGRGERPQFQELQMTVCKIKAMHQPIDMHNMGIINYVGFYRYFGFRSWVRMADELGFQITYGLGSIPNQDEITTFISQYVGSELGEAYFYNVQTGQMLKHTDGKWNLNKNE